MSSMFLSRARLKPDQSTAALMPILLNGKRLASHAGKALVWSLFADDEDRKRDFLWRWDGHRPGRLIGEFLILSNRPPVNPHNLFDLDTQDFAPALAPGDRLAFRLRANAVVRQRKEGNPRSTKHDVVMSELRKHPKDARRDLRETVMAAVGKTWLHRQLVKAGASPIDDELRIDGYQQHSIPDSRRTIEFSSLDFDGVLTVADPALFLQALMHGFGSAKAYGCGLMLIKRA